MLVYWLLFAYPAIMALAYPSVRVPYRSTGQAFALAGFVVLYTLIAGLRWDVGGDWGNYIEIYEDISTDSLFYALTVTDPLYGLFNWISAQFEWDIYFVNGVCGFLLAFGITRVVGSFRDPWLAIVIAVPYLLIVVGLGYVRQGAAIGLLLMAIGTFDRGNLVRTILYLVMAVGVHSTAVMVFPLFALSLAQRHKILAVLLGGMSIAAYFILVVPRLEKFTTGYFDQELESTGALARLLMSFLLSVVLLLRWRYFATSLRVRPIWISVAVANVIAFIALALSPSSTAVDRAGLYFSIAQLAVFGEARHLVPILPRMVAFVRIMLIGAAAVVQVVWLVFATNSIDWVPYKSLFDAP